jgi:hypothetical protein
MQPRFRSFAAPCLVLALLAGSSFAKLQCPAFATRAIEQTFPHTTVKSCQVKRAEDGSPEYRMTASAREDLLARILLDSAGRVSLAEKQVETMALPELVFAAFDTRYRNANMDGATQIADSSGVVSYGVIFEHRGRPLEAVFTPDGRFVEEQTVED